ncbi:hypothetical protein PI23P_03692 [Polaribacter irgensii 23-P]|uniref:Uncharacterized protein n=1 Tax=Polaribacter irgensii 23-P TaxID=313594 RepID=A4BX75_9FLAO|nr:hypothetical protein [Polaribacter irgensii]EAR13566.1 hypothetical protein PI23P_03692 [Polaribacter irgensii 23-P]
MEKKYKITEKQLTFLEEFLLRIYKDIPVKTRIELTDHLILDFEATTRNGNLSQYLSNEIAFIRKFTSTKIKLYKNLYRKETWQYFFSFFKDLNKLPHSVFGFIFFYSLSESLSNYWLWLAYMISYCVLFFLVIFYGMIHQKALKKLDEVKFLGAEIWWLFVLINFAQGLDFIDFLTQNSLLFSAIWFLTIFYSYAAYMIVKKHEKIIINKYKHLLN